MAKFSWPAYPSSEAEFEQLMTAIDKTLAAQDLRPFQRPLHVGRLFWEAFGWSGRVMKRKALPHQDSGLLPERTSLEWQRTTYSFLIIFAFATRALSQIGWPSHLIILLIAGNMLLQTNKNAEKYRS